MIGELIRGETVVKIGKNALKKWRLDSEPVFGGEKAGNRKN